MTYREICRRLHAAGVENPSWDTALILEHFCGIDATCAAIGETNYRAPGLEEAVQRREQHTPLQYILGEWQFFRQTYRVTPACLVPRSDTEILVQEAIKRLPKNAWFADLCTGCGCIAVSVLSERPDTRALGVDKFDNTMSLAVENAHRNGVADRFRGKLCDLMNNTIAVDKPFDAILSNPPYIPTRELQKLAPEVQKEPTAALDGGEDGLSFYRRLMILEKDLLSPDGFMLLEIGYDQAKAVKTMGKEAGFTDIRVIKDYGGNDRVVYLSRS